MLDSLYIGSYRGLWDVQLDNFADINILVGNNNSGKTSVLEAMILSGLFDDAELLLQTLISRYQQISTELVKDLFRDAKIPIQLKRKMKEEMSCIHAYIDYDLKEKTVLEETKMDLEKNMEFLFQYLMTDAADREFASAYSVIFKENKEKTEVEFRKAEHNQFEAALPCQFISFSRFDRTNYLINALDAILEQDKRKALLEVLQLFDPQVENFEVIGRNRNIKIFAGNRNQPLSLYDYGNGMYKAFYIASAALLSENGILLIDEIEAGIHRDALRKFIQYLIQICESKNIQLFITTHSLETLDLFLEYDKNRLEKIAAYNLRNDGEVTRVRRYSGIKLADLRQNMGLDIR